jgi:hypothetical protein
VSEILHGTRANSSKPNRRRHRPKKLKPVDGILVFNGCADTPAGTGGRRQAQQRELCAFEGASSPHHPRCSTPRVPGWNLRRTGERSRRQDRRQDKEGK